MMKYKPFEYLKNIWNFYNMYHDTSSFDELNFGWWS